MQLETMRPRGTSTDRSSFNLPCIVLSIPRHQYHMQEHSYLTWIRPLHCTAHQLLYVQKSILENQSPQMKHVLGLELSPQSVWCKHPRYDWYGSGGHEGQDNDSSLRQDCIMGVVSYQQCIQPQEKVESHDDGINTGSRMRTGRHCTKSTCFIRGSWIS